jgi:hypothetical protein
MFNKFKTWFARMSAVYPARWYWPIVQIYGGPAQGTLYMTRVLLSPQTPWGRLYLHIFHREDLDRDPHDHPFDFWTIPLNQSYIEEVFDRGNICFHQQRVPRWRISYRPATHTHRVTSAERGWPLITLVWRGTTQRPWGFWCHTIKQVKTDKNRIFIPWTSYCYEGTHDNIPGADEMCPGSLPNDSWDRFKGKS